MRPTLLILLRHGQCHDNLTKRLPNTDSQLTELGIQQSMAAANLLKSIVNDPCIITSPLLRAHCTAKILAAIVGGHMEEDADLREMNFGEAAGLTPAEFTAKFPVHTKLIEDSSCLEYSWPGGESRKDLLKRVRRVLKKYIFTCDTKDTIFISHWVTLGFMHAEICDGNLNRWIELSPSHATPLFFNVSGEKKIERVDIWDILSRKNNYISMPEEK